MAAPMGPARRLLGLAVTLGPGSRGYRAPPPPRRSCKPWWPDPDNLLTPAWQLGPRHAAKQFARFGAASGVDAGSLWPSPEQLRELEAEEREWHPSLAVMQESLRVKRLEEQRKRRERETLIAERMAQMPQMIENWRRQQQQRREKAEADKERRARLQAEAQERLGYHVDPRSARFQELLQDMEKQQRKRLKEEKLRKKKEARAAALASSTSTASITAQDPGTAPPATPDQ